MFARGGHREGRIWAMMLDLSTGKKASPEAVMNDWKFLCDRVKIREDARYLHHQKKPVVLLWGLGFKDRPWSPKQGEQLIHFLKSDPDYGATFRELGVRTVFVGMFDEVDEGTAIYKVANITPVGKHFANYEGLPADFYLRLTGLASSMIRGDTPLSWKIPIAQ